MTNFLKNVFAVLVALVLFTILMGITLLSLIVSATKSDKEEHTGDKLVLKIKLDKEIIERETDRFIAGEYLMGREHSSAGLLEITRAIDYAAKNEKVKGIYIELSSMQAGLASLNELRNHILEFKKTGKFVFAYGEYFSEGAYYLASAADSIILPPSGMIEFNGLNTELLFFKKTLEMLDVEVEVFKAGNYKSAVEPLTRENMSDYNREQIRSFMNTINQHMLLDIAQSRNISYEKLKNISDSMLIHTPAQAFNAGLITHVAYYDKIEECIRTKLKLSAKDKIPFISVHKLINESNKETYKNNKKNQIAVIYANGDIISGKGDEETIGSETLSNQIRKARNDENVKAIVLRVNSPGGSALASDVIWREIMLTKSTKPIIASMSDVAASGGYYISMACDTIVSSPLTLTGSIGVFAVMLNINKLLKNKLGITTDRHSTGVFSDMGTPTREMKPYEKRLLQQEVDNIYNDFVEKAAKGRKTSFGKMNTHASGRVWSGIQAKDIGLIDVHGGLKRAIEIAAVKASLPKDYVVSYWPESKSTLLKEIFAGFSEEYEDVSMKNQYNREYEFIKAIKNIKRYEGIQARIPFEIKFR
ncbi:MAG: signal peptide peptidase SppA [Cytophagaceae bacterium]|nr:signal peptide peptidase SppA [Cytophagaceae bacterium]MDW8455705.1 signal peptide peptidase SppA [Cytophagaceae bacterium]